MTRASALQAARGVDQMALDETAGSDPSASGPSDRRLSDSNQQWLGKVVDGRYRVLEVIGRGGMGVVYRVEHLRMGKVAAMKVLHKDLANDPEVIGRFEREASAVSRLHHPHTVQVFDFGNANGALYLIMEFVRGQDLGRIIERDGPLAWSRAAPLLAQICGALQEAHELGVVHRDLKPENVLITRATSGRDYAKVLDFGLAKLERQNDASSMASKQTGKQAIVGTPYFMAPEQIRGEDVDHRTDIYSFGALMFEVLTGQHLFSGSSAVGVLTKHLTTEPDAPSNRATKMGIPPQVDFICRKALAKDPSERWQTAAELAQAIEEVYTETVGDITGPGARSSARHLGALVLPPDESDESDLRLRRSDIDAYERGLKRRRYYLFAIVLIVLGGAGAALAGLLMREPPPLREEREPNDDTTEANRIAIDQPITGYLGRRHSPTEPDRDVYVVRFATGERHVVSVSVSGIPNIDLNLTVADANGRGVSSDENPTGLPESLHRRAITGPLVITIGETMREKFPVENVSDPYQLTIVDEPTDHGEIEPNNTDADATPLSLTFEQRGYLDTRSDVDLLRWTGEDGEFNIVVRADGVPLQWRISDGKPRTPGATKVTLKRGDIVRIDRTDRAGKGELAGRDSQWSVVVTP